MSRQCLWQKPLIEKKSIGLIGHNKRFLYLTTRTPEIIHDTRLLRQPTLFQEISRGNIISNKDINLGDTGEIPLVTKGYSAFPRLQWLIKGFNENTRDQKEKYFNRKLCSTRVVSENTYGMLKRCWRLLHKKCECKLYNTKYVIMAAVPLPDIRIYKNVPCKPYWRLDAEHLEFITLNISSHITTWKQRWWASKHWNISKNKGMVLEKSLIDNISYCRNFDIFFVREN